MHFFLILNLFFNDTPLYCTMYTCTEWRLNNTGLHQHKYHKFCLDIKKIWRLNNTGLHQYDKYHKFYLEIKNDCYRVKEKIG